MNEVGVPQAAPVRAGKRVVGVMSETQLTSRHRLMIDYMVNGLSHATLLPRLPLRYVPAGFDADSGVPLTKLGRPELGEALTLEDAAAACGIKMRAARHLARQPVFQRLLASETQAFREGAKARAIRRIDTLAHDPGNGTAADRKVQLQASETMLGEEGRRGVTVNVGVNVSTQIAPGIVVRRYQPRDQTPPKVIEHEENP